MTNTRAVLLVVLVVLGCGAPVREPPPDVPPSCVVGSRELCVCEPAGGGVRRCIGGPDGSVNGEWGACACL